MNLAKPTSAKALTSVPSQIHRPQIDLDLTDTEEVTGSIPVSPTTVVSARTGCFSWLLAGAGPSRASPSSLPASGSLKVGLTQSSAMMVILSMSASNMALRVLGVPAARVCRRAF